jgi:hypothetical protein
VAGGNSIQAIPNASAAVFAEIIAESTEPVLLPGFVADWPVVERAKLSHQQVDEYLRRFYQGASVTVFCGRPEIQGRYFYANDLSGLNFERAMAKLDQVLDHIEEHRSDAACPSYYVGSTTIDTCLPGFRSENDLDFGDIEPLASIWIGNRSRIAAHHDLPDNLACVAAGRRRFTLFPPEQLENLYVGPIDFTPAGQQISLVDFHNPDLERFPRFAEALAGAFIAEMEPGDALFLPSMWWHHVEALDSLNVLVNYWWRKSPDYMGQPIAVLQHALLSLRGLPPEQKRAWQRIFEYYVFGDESSVEHIPPGSRGSLAPLNEELARKIRALLLNKLNR